LTVVGESVARVITRFMENMPMLRILLGLAATVIAMAASMGVGPSLAKDKLRSRRSRPSRRKPTFTASR